jgi:hypothetical protein
MGCHTLDDSTARAREAGDLSSAADRAEPWLSLWFRDLAPRPRPASIPDRADSLSPHRRNVLPRLWRVPLLMIVVRLAACTAIESAHFGPSTAIERVIMRYYERNASESGCFHPTSTASRS